MVNNQPAQPVSFSSGQGTLALQSKRHALIGAFLAALLVFLVYLPVRNFEFLNFDDNVYVTQNGAVSGGLTTTGITWAFSNNHGGHWHPLAWVSHMLDVELFGLNAGAHHLVNAGIHSVSTLLVILFVTRHGFSALSALFIGLVFGLHPLRLESVAWVTERKDVLSLFFMLLSLIAYLAFVRTRSVVVYGGVLLAFVLALLSKPSAVVLPVLFLLLDFWPLRRLQSSSTSNPFSLRPIPLKTVLSLILEKAPFFLAALACGVLALWAQTEGGGLKSGSDYTWDVRTASAFVGLIAYVGKMFFPTGQGIFYPFEIYPPGVASGAALFLGVISVLVWLAREQRPYLLFGWLWFLVSLLPVIGVVQVGGQAFADRWSYLPHLGVLIGVVALWNEVAPVATAYSRTIAVLLVSLCIALTMQNLPHWRNSETIFRHTLNVAPENFMAHMNLGVALERSGKLLEASSHYDRAVMLRPQYPDALSNLASARAKLGDLVSAEQLLRRALSASPQFVPARYNLGILLNQRGDGVGAFEQFLQAFVVDPEYPPLRGFFPVFVSGLVQNRCAVLTGAEKQIPTIERTLAQWPRPRNEALRQGLISILKCVREGKV